MNGCCPHPPEDHEVLAACQEVIHYPSEDYPCLCTGHEGAERCTHCDHPAASHAVTRICKGEGCECRVG